MRILFDFDDVLNDLSKRWVQELNRRYDMRVRWEDVTAYDLRKSFPGLSDYQLYEPYLDGTLYLDINPVREAQTLINDLSDEHDLLIVTSNLLGVEAVPLYEYLWNGSPTRTIDYLLQFIGQYYPQIDHQNVIVTCRKDLIDGDVLIDDNPDNLFRFRGVRILIDKPYNRDLDTVRHNIRRVYHYNDIPRVIEEERY